LGRSATGKKIVIEVLLNPLGRLFYIRKHHQLEIKKTLRVFAHSTDDFYNKYLSFPKQH